LYTFLNIADYLQSTKWFSSPVLQLFTHYSYRPSCLINIILLLYV